FRLPGSEPVIPPVLQPDLACARPKGGGEKKQNQSADGPDDRHKAGERLPAASASGSVGFGFVVRLGYVIDLSRRYDGFREGNDEVSAAGTAPGAARALIGCRQRLPALR